VCLLTLSKNEAITAQTFDPIETIHIPVTGTCTEGHEFNPHLSARYAPDDLDLIPGCPKDHRSMGLTTWDVEPGDPTPAAYSFPSEILSSMAKHGNDSLKIPDDSRLVRMRPFFCHQPGCLGTVATIESGGDTIHFSVDRVRETGPEPEPEPSSTHETVEDEEQGSYRAVITAWRETAPEQGQTETETETNKDKDILLRQPAIVWRRPVLYTRS
jgi:hypothetical protein